LIKLLIKIILILGFWSLIINMEGKYETKGF
jgi:hypothetical protein